MAPLLRGLVDWLSCDNASCHDSWTHLRSSCVLAISALAISTSRVLAGESPGSVVTWTTIWEMILAEPDRPIDLVLACKKGISYTERSSHTQQPAAAFATYVCTTQVQHEGKNTLLHACGWDYLRDALLLILTDHFLDAEAPLAILVAPSICMALVSLIAFADGRTGKLPWYGIIALTSSFLASYILSSPWTMNLCTTLQELSQSTESQEEYTFYKQLRRRIASPAAELVQEVVTNVLRP